MSMVIAVREGHEHGAYIGFLLDREILECGECAEVAAYRIRYTEDQHDRMNEHRFQIGRIIEAEHPNHSELIRLPL